MAKVQKLSPKEEVSLHIQKLEPEIAEIVETIRQIILNTDNEISEQIKWNNPAFWYSGEMKAFDPKEYKRDIAVLNLYKGRIMLVFPSGAKVVNSLRLLEGDYKDGRRLITFKNLEDVESKANELQQILKEWISLVEK
ncbi:MAG: DUF1801 domain-containing protein [Flavobacterium sp.]|nr:MAG: DUF1801 domain-containing protein [Flavobacterium sp.]